MPKINDPDRPYFETPTAPAGGWGSLREVGTALMEQHVVLHGMHVLAKQNKTDGFACVSCSWAKPADPHAFEFCENGAKATAWEITNKRIPEDFFASHTLSELEAWSDHELESIGRLTEPMRYDALTDRYVPVTWEQAFADIGTHLQACDPKKVVFYASGRASLETSYMYQLMARIYGSNNLPDSSNMCHESSSVALMESIGVGVGTIELEDFAHTDCLLFFGHNTGTNAPRMLHPIQEARNRGVPVITVNPIKEAGLVRFANPQSPVEMLTPAATEMSSQYLQIRVGGDAAVAMGMAKWMIEADDEARGTGGARVVDAAFILAHTAGFEEFAQIARDMQWSDIEEMSGVRQEEIVHAARIYASAPAAMILYGMGITQHREGVRNIHMLTNLLLLRGNIGRPGAGICPIRGHSNVQGQRTVGITEKPELVPGDRLRHQFGFTPPAEKGMSTVEASEAMLRNEVEAFCMLGGNFVRAIPDHSRMEPAWQRLPLTVQILTKLNRSAVLHGKQSYLLPCLGRIEIDEQATGPQAVSVEDSTGRMHGSRGVSEPIAPSLLSEPAIVAGIAKAILGDASGVDWDAWVADYGQIREAIAETYPDIFHDFNKRLFTPGGFARPSAARERKWNTKNGKANFYPPLGLNEDTDMPLQTRHSLRLMTTRGDNQFNTTVYGLDDRFRGVFGTRHVLLMNEADMAHQGLQPGMRVTAITESQDKVDRRVANLQVQPFDIPAGCVVGYFPELNALVPLDHHAKESKVPAYKSTPIRLIREVD